MANMGVHMLTRKSKVRVYVLAGALLATASTLAIYHLAVGPIIAQAELSERQLAYVAQADPANTTAAFVIGHEHGPQHPAFTSRTITNAAHVELLLSATQWTIKHGHRDRWSFYFHQYRLTFNDPSGECAIWLSGDRSGWSFAEQPDTWYGGGHLLHLVFSVVYLAAGQDSHFYLSLQGYIGDLRYITPALTPDELDEYAKFLAALAPLIAKIEENPETPLDEFWELSGLSRDDGPSDRKDAD
ncbi:MAG: hypothetical protein KDB68_17270 [Planctomycetes bacterium]|nr:hypothetical protein [Planctomycetota bacterium]